MEGRRRAGRPSERPHLSRNMTLLTLRVKLFLLSATGRFFKLSIKCPVVLTEERSALISKAVKGCRDDDAAGRRVA